MTAQPRTIPVALGGRSYDILIAPGLLDRAGAEIAGVLPDATRLLPVADGTVWGLIGERLTHALAAAGAAMAPPVLVPPGEASKSLNRFGQVMEALLANKPDRRAVVLAIGGGVVGDLAGYAAASLLRGVRFVQVPTSLLAQVDSSVGGKTGINSAHGKNLIGAFHQPSLVLIDPQTLRTLPLRELRAGYAEVVKYAGLDRQVPLERLEALAPALFGPQQAPAFLDAAIEAIALSVASKARIVAQDEREAGVRAWLNLGHTFGHALEAMAQYDGRLLHGEAVALGLRLAYDHAVALGLCEASLRERIVAHLTAVGLPTDPGAIDRLSLEADDIPMLIDRMAGDKKAEAGSLTLVLPHALGTVAVHKQADPVAIRQTWAAALS